MKVTKTDHMLEKKKTSLKFQRNETTQIMFFDLNDIKLGKKDFPGGLVVKTLTGSAGDTVLIPGRERFHMPWSS